MISLTASIRLYHKAIYGGRPGTSVTRCFATSLQLLQPLGYPVFVILYATHTPHNYFGVLANRFPLTQSPDWIWLEIIGSRSASAFRVSTRYICIKLCSSTCALICFIILQPFLLFLLLLVYGAKAASLILSTLPSRPSRPPNLCGSRKRRPVNVRNMICIIYDPSSRSLKRRFGLRQRRWSETR